MPTGLEPAMRASNDARRTAPLEDLSVESDGYDTVVVLITHGRNRQKTRMAVR